MSEDDGLKAMGQVIQIYEARIRDHLGEMVRGTVEETLNALLDAEADRLCNAQRYERSEARRYAALLPFRSAALGKRLALLHELVPKAVRVTIIVNPTDVANTESTLRDV